MGEHRYYDIEVMLKHYGKKENPNGHLSTLAKAGSYEIRDHLLGKNNDFSYVQKLAEILGEDKLKDSDSVEFYSLSLPFWRAIKKESDKEIRQVTELALEMRLLRTELKNIPANSNKLKEYQLLLENLSEEFSKEQYKHDKFNHLVA